MTYCAKCGNKNDDKAEYCSKCGASLMKTEIEKDQCDEACVAGKGSPLASLFWGIVVILFGLWILIAFVIPKENLPTWLQEFQFWWLIGLIIAIAIIITGFRLIIKK